MKSGWAITSRKKHPTNGGDIDFVSLCRGGPLDFITVGLYLPQLRPRVRCSRSWDSWLAGGDWA